MDLTLALVLVALAIALTVTLVTVRTDNLPILVVVGVAFGMGALYALGVHATWAQDLVISMAMTFVALALTRLLMSSNAAQTVAARLPRRLPPL